MMPPAEGTRATRVKLCGMTDPDDVDVAVAVGVDAIGVIADVPVDTPREVTAGIARDLVAGVPPLVTSVLVTMPDSVQEAVRLAERVAPDAVQVHGGLGPGELGALGRRLDRPVIAAVDAAAPDIAAHSEAADALLVDSVGADGGGGTGETVDWERTRDRIEPLDAPVVLAGGLTPENVAEAVETVEPFGVDVASGIERAGGQKDHDAMSRFVRAATGVAAR